MTAFIFNAEIKSKQLGDPKLLGNNPHPLVQEIVKGLLVCTHCESAA
jgi:hypothetical protein